MAAGQLPLPDELYARLATAAELTAPRLEILPD